MLWMTEEEDRVFPWILVLIVCFHALITYSLYSHAGVTMSIWLVTFKLASGTYFMWRGLQLFLHLFVFYHNNFPLIHCIWWILSLFVFMLNMIYLIPVIIIIRLAYGEWVRSTQ